MWFGLLFFYFSLHFNSNIVMLQGFPQVIHRYIDILFILEIYKERPIILYTLQLNSFCMAGKLPFLAGKLPFYF